MTGWIDDFAYFVDSDFWTSLAADGGSTAFAEGDAEHGRLQGATGATDNNEILLRSTNELALFQADGAFIYEARIQFTEANTDDANVAVGLADNAGANLLSDDGGGDNINSSGVLIFKIDGGTTWRCACENNATIVETASVQTAGGADYQVLTIVGKAISSNDYEFTYFLDHKPLTDSNNRKILHTLNYSSATDMRIVAGYVKAGSANSETLNLDYCAFGQRRV